MKIFSASAYTLSLIQLLALIGTIVGYFFVEWSILNVCLIILGYFIYSGLGVSITYHRYYSHKSFEFKNKFLENLFLLFAIRAGRGSTIGWVYVHRLHHAFSDTPKDPHDPSTVGFKIFFPHLLKYGKTIDKKIIKDLFNRKQLYINKYYLLIIISFVLLLSIINFSSLYFFYIVPLFLTFLGLDLFVFLTHKYGYRNFDCKDNSKNNWFISLILWGEGWHNNHHKNPRKWSTKEKWWEIDMLGSIISVIKK